MKTLLEKFRGGMEGFRERSRQKAFLEVVMAGTALVACADRDERLSELVARDRILSRLAEILPFNTRDAIALYERYARRLDDQPEAGRREVLEKIPSAMPTATSARGNAAWSRRSVVRWASIRQNSGSMTSDARDGGRHPDLCWHTTSAADRGTTRRRCQAFHECSATPGARAPA